MLSGRAEVLREHGLCSNPDGESEFGTERSAAEPVRSGPLPARGLVCGVGRLSEF
jgi:hypothetical protein